MLYLLVWHLGVKIVMKYATAGFVIYGDPMNQALFETMKIGIRKGVSQEIHRYIHECSGVILEV